MTDARLARLVDAVQYAVGVTVVVGVSLAPLAVTLPAGPFWVKLGLFVGGTATVGYATYLAWPTSGSDGGGSTDPHRETRLQAAIRRLPPAAWLPIAPRDRYPNWARLYLAGVVMLVTSYLLETLLGVTA